MAVRAWGGGGGGGGEESSLFDRKCRCALTLCMSVRLPEIPRIRNRLSKRLGCGRGMFHKRDPNVPRLQNLLALTDAILYTRTQQEQSNDA